MLYIQAELVILVAQAQIDLFRRTVPLKLQLLLEPLLVKPLSMEVFAHYSTVHNHLSKDACGRRRQAEIIRCGGPLPAGRKNGQLAIVLKYRRLNGAQIEIAGLAAQNQEFAQIQSGFFHIFPVELPVVHQDGRRTINVFAYPGEFAGQDTQADGDQSIHNHGNERLNRIFQLGGKLCGNGADGDPGDIIEQIELDDLLVSHELCQNKQDSGR